MKVNCKFSLIYLGITILSVTFFSGCQSKPKSIIPYRKTSYSEVAPHLDPDGDVYFYLNTKQFGCALEESLTDLKKAVVHPKAGKQVQNNSLANTFDLTINMLKNSGIHSFAGLGISSIQLKKNLYHNKFFLNRSNQKVKNGNERLWQAIGTQSHKLRTLEMLPDNTVLAAFMDIDLMLLKNWLRDEIAKTNALEASDGLNSLKESFKSGIGLEISKVLYSLCPHAGMFITFHPDRRILWPVRNKMIQLPEPAIFFVLSVKDDFLFDFLYNKLKLQNSKNRLVIEKDLKMINVQAPLIMPPFFQPVVAQKDGLLVLGSNQHIVRSFFNKNISHKLIAQREFLALSKYMPTEGNGFKFISSGFAKTIKDIQKQILKDSMTNQQDVELIEKVNLIKSDFNFLGIYQMTEEGLLMNANSNTCLAKILAAQYSILSSAVFSRIILPIIKNYADSPVINNQ